jgi:opacity protein-like surface antigen
MLLLIRLGGQSIMREHSKSLRILMVVILALSIVLCGSAAAFADTISGTGSVSKVIPVNGTISPLIISVTHPAMVRWSIDPNNAVPFSAPTVVITNNTVCPINVCVSRLTKDATSSTLPFTDTPYDAKDWANLNLSDSKTYLALGLKIKSAGSAWNTGYNTATHWASGTGSTLFGTLNKSSVGIFEFDARHGLAFDTSYTTTHILEFIFNLN